MITPALLLAVMPRAPLPVIWAAVLREAMSRFEIASADRAAAFLANVAVESNECRTLEENLRYSAARLVAVWPKRFPTLAAAAPFAHNPERLANRVYANRLGNGGEASGDGWRFRGRGLMQITGRANYRAAGVALGLPLENKPEQLLEPLPAAYAAAHFFASRGCCALADSCSGDDDEEDFVRLCVVINGGRHGLAARRAYWARAKAALSSLSHA